MSFYPATKEAYAVLSYIDHYGVKIDNSEENNKNKKIVDDYNAAGKLGALFVPYTLNSIKIGNNEYVSSYCQFGFSFSKNNKEKWGCQEAPPKEFEELISLAMPLWGKYTGDAL